LACLKMETMIKNFLNWIGYDKIAAIIVFALCAMALVLIVPSLGWASLGVAAAVTMVLGVPWLRQMKEEDLLAVTTVDYDNILTHDQAVGARRYAAKWRRVFFSTAPAQREKCQEAATRLYQACGLAAPSFVWLDSPFQAAVALSIICVDSDDEARIQMAAPMFPAMLNDHVYIPGSGEELTMHRAAMAEVSHEIKRMALIRSLVASKLRREMRSSPAGVWAAWGDVYASIKTQAPQLFMGPGAAQPEPGQGDVPQEWMKLYERTIMKNVPSFFDVIGSIAGRHGAPELLEYEIAYKWRKGELGVKYDQPPGSDEIAKANYTLAQNLGWWIPLGNVVIFTEGPTAIRLDTQGRLSAEGAPAMEYRDGWQVHAVEGTLLPAEWGAEAPERWKLDWLLQSGNQAERRLLMEKMDYERLLREEKNASLVHQEGDMRLYMIERRDDDEEYVYYNSKEPIMLLKVSDPSTGADYVLRVPPEMNTCEQARRWTLHDETGSVRFIKET